MSTEMNTTQKLTSAFNRQKCWMIRPLAEQINYSNPSIRRFLAKIGYTAVQWRCEIFDDLREIIPYIWKFYSMAKNASRN